MTNPQPISYPLIDPAQKRHFFDRMSDGDSMTVASHAIPGKARFKPFPVLRDAPWRVPGLIEIDFVISDSREFGEFWRASTAIIEAAGYNRQSTLIVEHFGLNSVGIIALRFLEWIPSYSDYPRLPTFLFVESRTSFIADNEGA